MWTIHLYYVLAEAAITRMNFTHHEAPTGKCVGIYENVFVEGFLTIAPNLNDDSSSSEDSAIQFVVASITDLINIYSYVHPIN